MFRILFILGLVFTGNVLAAESDDNVKRFRDYFERQELPYVQPLACAGDAACSIVGDFNGDDAQDFAALYEYVGPTSRYAGWSVDLVVVYSQEGSEEPQHAVYKNVAQIGEDKRAAASLTVQAKGAMRIPIGEFNLDNPGINIVSAKSRSPDQDTTLYWQGNRFYAVDKATD